MTSSLLACTSSGFEKMVFSEKTEFVLVLTYKGICSQAEQILSFKSKPLFLKKTK